jgi:hypothetical protein
MFEREWLPEGWKRGDRLRVINARFRDGRTMALMHVPDTFVANCSDVPLTGAIHFDYAQRNEI